MMMDADGRQAFVPTPLMVGQMAAAALLGAERLLWEAAERALRAPAGRVVVVLHLSRLTPPAPRPHHIRVARVLLQDSASRFGGQVFAMRNQDLVLLCTRGERHNAAIKPGQEAGATQEQVLPPETLPATLARLFSADAPAGGQLTSLWSLEKDAPSLLTYLGERAASPTVPEPQDEPTDGLVSLTALQAVLARTRLADLMIQQTGMSLDEDRGKPLALRLAPAFRELELSLATLNQRPLVARATADPYLFRHLASGLDSRLIALLSEDFANAGPLTRPAVEAGLPIHIDLGLDAILSPGFARLSRQAGSAGVRFGASVSMMQACADLDLMEHASRVLRLTGGELVLSRVDPAALGIVVPSALQPDLLKLMWSPSFAAGGRVVAAGKLQGIDPHRTVLQGVDSPAALAWGQSQGITQFQGPFLDQVQAATRMSGCRSASGCTVRQCAGRAAALARPGRAGCSQPALLDLWRRQPA